MQAELQVPADVAYVGLARLVVTTAARQAGMGDERIQDLKIAVSEATAQAIAAHRRRSPGGPVILRFGPVDDAFEVRIAGAGPAFVEKEATAEAADDLDEGLGVALVRNFADSVDVVESDGDHSDVRFALGFADAADEED